MPSVNEKCERKERFAVCGEVSRGYEAELRVRGDRVLYALELKFCSHGEIVEPIAEFVTESDELNNVW